MIEKEYSTIISRLGGRKFFGVLIWTFFWGLTLVKGIFWGLPPEGWTFLSASITPATVGIWSVYIGANVWSKKNGK